ncbi:DMT family transporter [Rhodobacteraceae bacterium RKSG542]|uniref:DMT family transporter n=1 Tax=Pseudovibrio flavus TaxID=2529854 RepID=UPI0012BB6B51|nr:DMT family transporter [Pseudovibrio flavus]MTI16889.1 DMT family transporter [Pseudovibrio flavus]
MSRNCSVLKAIGLVSAAFMFFSMCDTAAKLAGQYVPAFQVAFFRYAVQFIAAFVFFKVWQKPQLLYTKRPVAQLFRSILLLCGTTFNFIAVRHLQLAETGTIMFASPFVIAALSGPILGEWAGPRRWAAIVVGFIGILIVVQPGSGAMHWAAIFSVLSMLSSAGYFLMTRILAPTESNQGMLVISALVGTVALIPPAYTNWVAPDCFEAWAALFMAGVFAFVGHWFLTEAYKLASASVLAPFIYQQIIWMVLFGFMFFGDIPTITTVIGSVIIVGSGLYLLYRERVSSDETE